MVFFIENLVGEETLKLLKNSMESNCHSKRRGLYAVKT
jgi:hypothetical protein